MFNIYRQQLNQLLCKDLHKIDICTEKLNSLFSNIVLNEKTFYNVIIGIGNNVDI